MFFKGQIGTAERSLHSDLKGKRTGGIVCVFVVYSGPAHQYDRECRVVRCPLEGACMPQGGVDLVRRPVEGAASSELFDGQETLIRRSATE